MIKKRLLYASGLIKYNNKRLIQGIFMYKFILSTLMVLMIISYSSTATATSDAEKAAKSGLEAVTVFIDISRFSRKNGAAEKMTESHQDFARFGYILVAVNVYTENGDLEGFFVSYRKDKTQE
ncbi:hypothetical protein GCM10011365_09840 [Marinicella pacifica]|uniref:Uncharacterized protein n=3 Tax=Marinicella pacifica TaxID=1171543 RepID=A0A917FLZ7_9GAMM|nr:hypothetical protein GCM10011365_09840 [Marinicella pacifica]